MPPRMVTIHHPPEQPTTIVTLNERHLEPLIAKLRDLERAVATFPDHGDVAAAIETLESPENPGRVTFSLGPDAAALRACDQLRLEGSFPPELSRLRDALLMHIGASAITYRLDLRRPGDKPDRSQVFFSYSGSYEVGARLPLLPEGSCWEVVEVKPPPDETGADYETLVCESCELADARRART